MSVGLEPPQGRSGDGGFRLLKTTLAACSLVAAVLLAGCESTKLSDTVLGSSYQPTNVKRRAATLPPTLRRVALLPLAAATAEGVLEQGRTHLSPVVLAELNKAQRFEVVPVSAEQMQRWTGQTAWSAEEKLPLDMLDKVRDETGCQGVLFVQLTVYRPYPPLAVGWRMKLVEVPETTNVWWAADEVFDAGNEAVSNGARRHQQSQQSLSSALQDSHNILGVPRRFGAYTASALFATLPER
ncbi:MAG: hypothetical protein HZA90_14065 [Verrucomicrobia bacterium]|nr:hypothetical protein [Verrucomicrobiota bacterium]